MKYLKTFESKKGYLLYPIGKIDKDFIGHIRFVYYKLKRLQLNPKIFTLNHNETYNFSDNLRESDWVIRFDNNKSREETLIHNRSYVVDQEECKRMLVEKVKLKDLEMFINSKKYNL